MTEETSPIVTPEVVEFATAAVPFCSLLQEATKVAQATFVDRLLKILPLLYVKASLLPSELPEGYDDELEEIFLPEAVSESEYSMIQRALEDLFAREDLFLEVLSDDMEYSDTPLTAKISECLADIYQPIGNMLGILRNENFEALPYSIHHTRALFAEYWGDRLLTVLRALHKIAYSQQETGEEVPEAMTEEAFEAQIDKMFD